MKVAGGLLMALGGFWVIMNILYQNDTGNKLDPLSVLIGIALFVVGLIVFNIKSKKNN